MQSNRARAASWLGPWSLSVAEVIQVALNKFTELISLQDHILIWVIQKDERTTWRTDAFNTQRHEELWAEPIPLQPKQASLFHL